MDGGCCPELLTGGKRLTPVLRRPIDGPLPGPDSFDFGDSFTVAFAVAALALRSGTQDDRGKGPAGTAEPIPLARGVASSVWVALRCCMEEFGALIRVSTTTALEGPYSFGTVAVWNCTSHTYRNG